MKKQFFLTIITLFLMTFVANAQELTGEWKTVDEETNKVKSIVKIYKAKNGKYYGQVMQILDKTRGPNPLCDKCTDDRKGKPVLNMLIINDMVMNNNNTQLSGGKILDPQKGKEYSCKIWLEGKNLKVRGYWGVFYRTQTWHKN